MHSLMIMYICFEGICRCYFFISVLTMICDIWLVYIWLITIRFRYWFILYDPSYLSILAHPFFDSGPHYLSLRCYIHIVCDYVRNKYKFFYRKYSVCYLRVLNQLLKKYFNDEIRTPISQIMHILFVHLSHQSKSKFFESSLFNTEEPHLMQFIITSMIWCEPSVSKFRLC